MANANAPFGFKPIRSLTGGAHVSCTQYKIASGTARIGKGDLVSIQSSGYIARETSATAVGPWLGISLADSGAAAPVGGISFHPVCDDQNAVLEVQGPTAALTAADLGRIVKVNGGTAPNSNTGLSQNVLTNTAATASNGVRLMRLANRPDNAFGAYQIMEVVLNSRLASSAGI